VLAALVAPLVSLACTADPYVSIADWNLSTVGAPGARGSPIHAPQRFDDLLPRSPTTYWLDADVALPPSLRGRPLTLTWADTKALATLSVDGQTLVPVFLLPFDRVRPSRAELVFRLPETVTGGATIHLRLCVRHVGPWTARIGRPPRLAPGMYGEHQLHLVSSVNYAIIVATAAVLALLALASGLAFVIDRRRVAAGWYALMNLGILISGLTGLGVAQLVVPSDVRRTPLIAVPLVCISGIAFTRAQFRLEPARRVYLALAALGVLGLVLGWPTFGNLRWYFLVLLLQLKVVAVFQTPTMVRLVRKPESRGQALGNLAAMAVLAGGVLLEIPPHLIDVFPLACIVCTSAQGLMLLRMHAVSQRALNATLESRASMLEERNQEANRLNEELRFQADDRSERLAAALDRLQQLSGPPPTIGPTIGAVLGGRYKILGTLGEERTGALYEVERIGDGRRFALKMLAHDHDRSEVAQIAHPNVVDIVEVDVDASGWRYLVMELVRGGPLSANRARFGDLSFAREVVRQVARGLAALHDAGIVHGNLRPGNLLLESRADGTFCVKIVDFGLRRVASRTVLKPAADGVLGTDGFIPFVLGDTGEEIDDDDELVYSAPELSAGADEAGPACDLWSLGVVAHQLGCRRLPCLDRTPDLEALTGSLRRVVEWCLELDPRRRPSAAQVVAALA
jgi:hypothetical protein